MYTPKAPSSTPQVGSLEFLFSSFRDERIEVKDLVDLVRSMAEATRLVTIAGPVECV